MLRAPRIDHQAYTAAPALGRRRSGCSGDSTSTCRWNKQEVLSSLDKADTPADDLNPDGNRAVVYCPTTEAYQVVRHPDPATREQLTEHAAKLARRSLKLIRDGAPLNVRIPARNPLAIHWQSTGPSLLRPLAELG